MGSDDRSSRVRRAKRYWRVMHKLLKRDYLTRADWGYALRDLSRMAKAALEAREAIVAVFVPASGSWFAVSSSGERLDDEEISIRASRSVLERVRTTGKPVLETGQAPRDLDSASLDLHQVRSVLSIPLYWWDVTQSRPQRELSGCLYVDRTLQEQPFDDGDVEMLGDIAEVAQRTLNVLRYLKDVQSSLQLSRERIRDLERVAASRYTLGQFETRDPWFAEHVLGPLGRAAAADKVGLLLLGPTGSGKSHLARVYHYESARRDGPFVVLDCSQVTSEQTLAAELFGYTRHSGFANAPEHGRPGAAAQAHKGTLFIDEIATLPPALQHRLLTLIQEGTFSPLGTSEKQKVDIRIVSATNEDLEALVREGRFREDLYWRISEMTLCLPPLNQRPADIPHLARGFLDAARERFGRSLLQGFTDRAESALLNHDWSRAGNLRGLDQTVHRSVLLAPPEVLRLDAEHLKFQPVFSYRPARGGPAQAPPPGAALDASASAQETLRRLLERKIAEHGGRASSMSADPEVARALGYERGWMPHSTLRVRLRELELETVVAEARQAKRREMGRAAPHLEAILAAIREHGSGSAAARALGINRDVLVWELRRASLTVRKVLAQE
jgi:transcriptional regulator with PAS, ATPase and Fis domain